MIRKNFPNRVRRMVMAVLIWAVLSPAAYAVTDVSSARIVKIGINPAIEGPMVQLVDTAANPKWTGIRQFYLSAELGNAGLATLLTAFSLGETVWVRIAETAEPGSLIMIIFVNAPEP